MALLYQFKDTLNKTEKVFSGKIIKKTDKSVFVTTQNGLSEVYTANPSNYQVAETLTIRNGVIIDRERPEDNLPKYHA